jgi:hypothetical protein
MFVAGAVLLVPVHYVATWLTPLIVEMAGHAGTPAVDRGAYTTALAGSPANGVLALPMPVGLLAGLTSVACLRGALSLWPHRMYALAGASGEKAAGFVERQY